MIHVQRGQLSFTAIDADQTLAAAESRLAADQIQIFLALGSGWQT